MVLFSVVPVYGCVGLFVKTITVESFEISSWNFYGSKTWPKARTIRDPPLRRVDGDLTSLPFWCSEVISGTTSWLSGSASGSERSHFRTYPSFWPCFTSIKISWWYLKRFNSYRFDKHTHTLISSKMAAFRSTSRYLQITTENNTTFAIRYRCIGSISMHARWYCLLPSSSQWCNHYNRLDLYLHPQPPPLQKKTIFKRLTLL